MKTQTPSTASCLLDGPGVLAQLAEALGQSKGSPESWDYCPRHEGDMSWASTISALKEDPHWSFDRCVITLLHNPGTNLGTLWTSLSKQRTKLKLALPDFLETQLLMDHGLSWQKATERGGASGSRDWSRLPRTQAAELPLV